jgi:hypothetical protein
MIVNIFSTSRSLVKRRMRTDIIAENGRAAGETSKALRMEKEVARVAWIVAALLSCWHAENKTF